MPEEVLALLIISIISFTILSIIGMTLRYKSSKAERAEGTGSSSLTTSELERMMKRAVRDATAPLEEKLERLEDSLVLQITSRQKESRQIESAPKDLLSDVDLHQSEDELEKTRVRSRS